MEIKVNKIRIDAESFDIPVGGGMFRVAPGDPDYGAVCIDFIVKDGKRNECAIPIVTIESPTTKEVQTQATNAEAVSVYVYGDAYSDEYTHKTEILHSDVVKVAADEGVDVKL